MMGTTHQMIALLTAGWVLLQYPTSPGTVVAISAVVAVMMGALTPDLDQPTAALWKRLLGSRAISHVFDWFSGGHRHLTHSVVGIVGIGWLTRWLIITFITPGYIPDALFIWSAFMIGYLSHPIADTLTDKGVPWLWPLHINIKIPPGPEEVRVTTDSWVERIIVRGGLLIAATLLLFNHWPIFKLFFWSAN